MLFYSLQVDIGLLFHPFVEKRILFSICLSVKRWIQIKTRVEIDISNQRNNLTC